ncbi:hypothetical protein V8F06_006123 [Rhypophila decipiens]
MTMVSRPWHLNLSEGLTESQPGNRNASLRSADVILTIYEPGSSQAACSDLISSLGLNQGIKLYNATNDAVAEILSFTRVFQMTASELEEWRKGHSADTEMDVDWATYDGAFHKANHDLGREVADERDGKGPKYITIGRAWA